MSKEDTIKKLGGLFKENLPHILTGVGAVGVVTTAIEAARAVLKIKAIDENEEDERKASDKAKSVFLALLPAFVSGGLTIGCIVSSDIVNTQRYGSLLGAFVLTKGELEKHKNDLKELLGPEKVKELEHQLTKKRIEGSDLDDQKNLDKNVRSMLRSEAHVKRRVVDQITGAEFDASYAALVRAEKEVCAELARSGHCTLEYFYEWMTDCADYPEIATRIYWDSNEWQHDMMNLKIGVELTADGETYYTLDYEYNMK